MSLRVFGKQKTVLELGYCNGFSSFVSAPACPLHGCQSNKVRCTGLEQPAFGHCVLVLGQFILWWFRVNRCLYQAPQDRCQGDSTLPVSALLSIYDTNHPSKICSEKNFKYRCLTFMDEQMLSAESEMCRIATGQLLTLLPSRASSSWTNGIHGLDRLSPLHTSPKFHLSFLRASALDESLCFAICVQKGCSVI